MAINFTGLVSGLDTTALVEGIMAADRKPIERLQNDRAYQSTRLEAYGVFDQTLSDLLTEINTLNDTSNLAAKKSSLTGETLVSATTDSDAFEGSYQIKSFSLAQVEKDVSAGYADKVAAEFGTGTLGITIGTPSPTVHNITIDATNNSLEGIMTAINDADIGVKAAIINDGTSSPYRLVISGNTSGAPEEVGFSVDTTGLSGGTYANPTFTETQKASQAHLQVDGIDLYSNSNAFDNAIPGVNLTAENADAGIGTATLSVSKDQDSVTANIQSFVTKYNNVMTFVTSQSAFDGKPAGLLAGDAGINSVKRRLQNILTTRMSTSGSFKSLSELGLETQKDGTLLLDSTKLTAALNKDTAGVSELLAGNGTTTGIANEFKGFLTGMTDTFNGFLAGRKTSINSNVERMDQRILQMQTRLDKREQTLLAKFSAMEELVSGLNAQGDYLTQQIDMMKNLWSQK